MIYYDPSLSESEVAQALESPEFVKAWNAHQTKSSGVPYNVEGGFDVLDKFKADQKEGFRQAAPIIHDLVMDVVRSTGGEIPYAMYVISEDGYMAYIGGQIGEKIDDIKATAQFAHDHPLQAGGLAVVAIASNGRVIGAKGTRKRTGIFKKANPSKGKLKLNVVPPNNPATHGGGKVATGQPATPSPSKGKDSKNSKKELQAASVSNSRTVGGSDKSKSSSSSKDKYSKDSISNDTNEPGKSYSNASKAEGGIVETAVGNMPDRVKWIREGGRFITHADGSTTFIKNGVLVRYNPKGFPDFRPFLYKGKDGKSEVRIKLTNDRYEDFKAANKAAGFDKKPAGYTWHHNEDVGLMQLVKEDVHADFWHTGGFSLGKN